MPIHKLGTDDKFVPFEKTPFPDLEKVLEDWIEKNPHLVLEDENLAIFARQPRTTFDKYLDLLAIDETGATVIIELKRGETPRDVVAQALEYAAWVDNLSIDQLNEIARDYASKHDIKADGLADLYRGTFVGEVAESDDSGTQLTERITFNNRQRLVIVGEKIANEVEQTLRYLRTRFGADVYGVEFSIHKAGAETLISTTTVVGREKVSKPAQSYTPRERESDESIRSRVKGSFMQSAVTAIEEWVSKSGVNGLTVDHSTGPDHFLRYLGVSWLYYYYAASWIYMVLYQPAEHEVELLRKRLSKPEEVKPMDKQWRFHVATDSDLEVVKEIVLLRVQAKSGATA